VCVMQLHLLLCQLSLLPRSLLQLPPALQLPSLRPSLQLLPLALHLSSLQPSLRPSLQQLHPARQLPSPQPSQLLVHLPLDEHVWGAMQPFRMTQMTGSVQQHGRGSIESPFRL